MAATRLLPVSWQSEAVTSEPYVIPAPAKGWSAFGGQAGIYTNNKSMNKWLEEWLGLNE